MSNWFNAGRVRPVAKGEWSGAVSYTALDYVIAPNGLRTYIAAKDVPVGTPLDNTNYWQVLVDAAALEKRAVDKLTSPFSETGSVVSCHPVEDYPLEVKTAIEPVQAGSGDPAPDNIRAISGHTGAVLTRDGKNLIKPTLNSGSIFGATITNSGNGYYTINGTPAQNGVVIIAEMTLPAGTYTLSYTIDSGNFSGNSTNRYVAQLVDADRNSVLVAAYTDIPYDTYTLTEAKRVYIRLYGAANRTYNGFKIAVQLENGNSASTYEPYQGNAFAVDFGQTVYGGIFNWYTGVLTIAKAFFSFDGTEYWFKMTDTSFQKHSSVFATTSLPDSSGGFGTSTCSHFTNYNAHVATGGTDGTVGVFSDNSPTSSLYYYKYFRWGNGSSTLDEWKVFLAAQYAAGTPVQICYELAEPITIQLTPQQILALRGTNTLWNDAGTTSVSGRIAPEWLNDQLKNAIIALGGHV